ncbi:8098_t:CDS:2 [Dentiscutata erythropus]|uniref:8098_t:CDS:1 n=1 Tax=Dentiscutata erythropus TaxID=1348616 RepID=A0A9N9C982_9GLOM|nr:8098_t:CDS:2 [Dentiscutata erythropus]
MSNTQYRETAEISSELSENDINRFRNDFESETRSNASSLPTSFVRDFEELNIEDQRLNRYGDEVSSETASRNDMTVTNTSLSTGTVTNHATATAPSDTVLNNNNTHVSTGSSTIVPSVTTDDARIRKREQEEKAFHL